MMYVVKLVLVARAMDALSDGLQHNRGRSARWLKVGDVVFVIDWRMPLQCTQPTVWPSLAGILSTRPMACQPRIQI
jgi:hypothetical protein